MSKIGGYEFGSPQFLDTWEPPSYGGIYAIILEQDPRDNPQMYTILYIGQTENFSERGINSMHPKYNCWKFNSNFKQLCVCIRKVSSENERKEIEKSLIAEYAPVCNG